MFVLLRRAVLLLIATLSVSAFAQPAPPNAAVRRNAPPPGTPISGEVVDDESGQSVDRFIVMEALVPAPGQEPHFSLGTMKSFDASAFTFERKYRTGGKYWTVLRIAAPGYAACDTEPVIADSKGDLKIRLKRAEMIRIPVKLSDGSSLANGTVFTVDQKGFLSLSNAKVQSTSGQFFVAPIDDAGNAAFSAPTPKYGGIVLADEGYAIFDSNALPASLTIVPWATINVTVNGLGESNADGRPMIRFLDHARRDWLSNSTNVFFKNGQAQLANMFAGEGRLELSWLTRDFSAGASLILDQITLNPGETADKTYTLPTGTVVGTIEAAEDVSLPNDPGRIYGRIGPADAEASPLFVMPKDIEQWPAEKLAAYAANWEDSEEGKAYRAAQAKQNAAGAVIQFNPNVDHSFTVKRVTPGAHTLTLQIQLPTRWLNIHKQIDVADGKETDVGAVKFEVPPALKLGAPAPEIDLPMLSGNGRFRLSEHRGKVVLVDVWSTDCGPCVREMPDLKKLHEKFASTKQFELVSIAGDEVPITPYAFMRSHGYNWTQVHLPNYSDSKFFDDYQLLGLPALFLVDKGGNLIAKDPKIEELSALIDKALSVPAK
jgi:thiol-disulfide isomerase/thioredoxin